MDNLKIRAQFQKPAHTLSVIREHVDTDTVGDTLTSPSQLCAKANRPHKGSPILRVNRLPRLQSEAAAQEQTLTTTSCQQQFESPTSGRNEKSAMAANNALVGTTTNGMQWKKQKAIKDHHHSPLDGATSVRATNSNTTKGNSVPVDASSSVAADTPFAVDDKLPVGAEKRTRHQGTLTGTMTLADTTAQSDLTAISRYQSAVALGSSALHGTTVQSLEQPDTFTHSGPNTENQTPLAVPTDPIAPLALHPHNMDLAQTQLGLLAQTTPPPANTARSAGSNKLGTGSATTIQPRLPSDTLLKHAVTDDNLGQTTVDSKGSAQRTAGIADTHVVSDTQRAAAIRDTKEVPDTRKGTDTHKRSDTMAATDTLEVPDTQQAVGNPDGLAIPTCRTSSAALATTTNRSPNDKVTAQLV